MIKIKKILLLSTFVFPSLGIVYSCNNDKVTITIVNEDNNKGSVNGSTFTVTKNSYVKLIANPKEGFLFTGWFKVEDSTEYGHYFESTYFHQATANITLKAKWENFSSKSFVFKLNETDGTYTLKSYFGDEENIIVPITHHGRKVTTIGKKTFSGVDCKSITINDGIIGLEDSAFEFCNTESIILPNTLEKDKLGTHPFKGWTTNNTITLRNSSIDPNHSNKTLWGWELSEETISQEQVKIIKEAYNFSDKNVKYSLID